MSKPMQDLCEKQSKLIVDSLNITDKYFNNLAMMFSSYNKHSLRTLNKFDELACTFEQYSKTESNGENTSTVLLNFSKAIALLGDFRELEVQRIENFILPDLQQYDLICKNTKENVKEISIMRDKELAKTKQIYQIKHKNDNLFRKRSGDADSKRSRLEVSKTFHVMEEIVENFEKQKLHDLKQVLKNFILIQMKHYSKAMEVLTATYQDVADIDEIGDVEKIKKQIIIQDDSTQDNSFKNIRSQSLSALSSMFPSTSGRRRPKPSLQRHQSSTSINSSQEEDYDSDKQRKSLKKKSSDSDSTDTEDSESSSNEKEEHKKKTQSSKR